MSGCLELHTYQDTDMQGLDKFPPAVVLWVVAYGLHVQAGKGRGVQCDRPIIAPLRPEAGRWSGLGKTGLKDAMSRQERARRLGINCFLRGSYFHL